MLKKSKIVVDIVEDTLIKNGSFNAGLAEYRLPARIGSVSTISIWKRLMHLRLKRNLSVKIC